MRTDMITRNYLQYCYDCNDAAACDTEADCMACWKDRGLAPAEERQDDRNMTGFYLQLQYD